MTMGGCDAGGGTASCLNGARRLRWPHGVLRCGLSSGEEGCRAVAVVSGGGRLRRWRLRRTGGCSQGTGYHLLRVNDS